MTKVKFLSAVTSIQWGTEMYGPYEKNQVDDLPPELVQRLTPKGLVSEVLEELKEKPTLATYLPREPREPTVVLPQKPGAKEAGPTPQKTAFDKLLELVGSDLVEIFGDAGTGKSRLLGHIALEAQEAGKSVLFLDNENSLPRAIASKLKNYEYVGIDINQIIHRVANIGKQHDLICLDSIGYPALIRYFELPLQDRLTAIGKLIVLRGYLKNYAITHKGLAIGTNQLESEFAAAGARGEEERRRALEELEPFGGKGKFISKLLIKTRVRSMTQDQLAVGLFTFKSRDFGHNTELAEFRVTSDGTELNWKR